MPKNPTSKRRRVHVRRSYGSRNPFQSAMSRIVSDAFYNTLSVEECRKAIQSLADNKPLWEGLKEIEATANKLRKLKLWEGIEVL